MIKKSGMFDKAKHKGGIVDGGIDNILKQEDEKPWKYGVRVCTTIPAEMRQKYKSLLAQTGENIQEDLYNYIKKYVDEHKGTK